MPPDAATAFFSYSREDSEFALRLAGDLKASGADVWLDQLDIAPGQRWARAVEQALRNAPRILVILSPASVESHHVEDEVNFALDEQKTVIPVFYRACEIPFRLRPLQYVDFRRDYARGLKELLRTLNPEQSTPAISDAPRQYQSEAIGAGKGERGAEEERREPVEAHGQGDEQGPVNQEREQAAVPKPRVVDAAIPSDVVKDLGTELLVLIRLPDSPGLRGILQREEEFGAHPEDVRSRPFSVVFPLGPTGRPEPKFPFYSLFRSTSGLQWININPLFFSENRGKMGWSARLLAPAWYLSTTPVLQTLA